MTDSPKLDPALSAEEKRALLARLLEKKIRESKTTHVLSYNQQSMWFLYRLVPDSPAYNASFTFRIKSTVDVPALQKAFQQLINRHPALRTTIQEQVGEAFQVVHGHKDVYFKQIDAATWDDTHLHEQLITTYEQPFDLGQGPVMRVYLFTSSTTDHILMLMAHHIIFDGWSVWVLLDELRTLYAAEVAGQPASLPPLTAKYTDYVQWQHNMLAGPAGERLWNYWQQQLAGELPVLNLPTDRPRPATQTYNGATHVFEVDVALTQQIKALGQAEGATLYMTMLAAFQILLYRYTQQDDIIIGSPVTDRSQAEYAGVIGDFVNMVALRANLSGNPSFSTFLKQTRRLVLDTLDHQGFPFPLLVDRLELERDSSRSPIFQVVFDLQRLQQSDDLAAILSSGATPTRINFGGLELESYTLPQQEGQFDLTLQVVETGNSLLAVLKYNTDLFEAKTITRMENYFQTLLESIVANPNQSIAELPILPPAEQEQLLMEWNSTQMEYPEDQCLHQLVEAQAEKSPDATAVVFEDQSLTYRELNERANQLAHYLQTLGVGSDTLVGLHVERSLEMVVGLLGILKAGGGYVPLDPAFPEERLAFMLVDSQAPVLLTQNRLKGYISTQTETAVICLDSDWSLVAQHPTANLPNVPRPDNLAYVIYTSGSTGKPKGVQLQHQGVVNFLTTMRQEPGLTAKDVLLSVTTLSFDISVLEIFLPLTTGAQVVLTSRETAADGVALKKKLSESGATIMQATPTTWRMLIDSGWEGNKKLKVLCGGEALPRELANQLLERCASLWNMYGPTETTIWSTVYQIQPGEEGSVSIGRPIGNTQCYVLDAQLQPVPIGVPGELHIGGDGLARGYLNRAELTAEKFIDDPFNDKPGARLYKTGDLVCYLPDGRIEFLSRIDHQIKIRGFRVELGEIETVLANHPAIHEAVVIMREDVPGDKRLVAYLIANEDEEETATGDLRAFVREELTDYMVPSIYVFLDTFPLTPNKKIDRKALPVPDLSRPDLAESFATPRDEVEEKLAEIWKKVLHLKQIGIHDNFFELGGHSLLATQVMARIRQQFQVEIPLNTLFDNPTVLNLAQCIKTTAISREEIEF